MVNNWKMGKIHPGEEWLCKVNMLMILNKITAVSQLRMGDSKAFENVKKELNEFRLSKDVIEPQ